MALNLRKSKLAELENTGFSTITKNDTNRFINKDGTANVKIIGGNFISRFSGYHYLLELSNVKFFFLIIFFYTIINFLFALLYLTIGIEHLSGLVSSSFFDNFVEAYFFSSQTLTTVGYGRVSPVGLVANIAASFEALIGILTLAIITGILYGRFTKPKAYIRYSKNVIIAPFKDGTALMFRIAPTKSNVLSDVTATLTMSIISPENEVTKSKFFNLPLELDKINNLALSWTIVHNINDESPLNNFTAIDIEKNKVQLIVNIRAFDEGFSNTVVSRSGYIWEDIVVGAKFVPMFSNVDKEGPTILDLNKINEYVEV